MDICVINDLGKKQNQKMFHFEENDTITTLFCKIICGLKMNHADKQFFNKEINQPIHLPDEVFLSCLLRSYEDFIYKRGTDFSQLYSIHREKYLKPRKIKPEFDFKTIHRKQSQAPPNMNSSGGFNFLNLAMGGLSAIFGSPVVTTASAAKNVISSHKDMRMRESVASSALSVVNKNEANYYSEDEDYEYYSRGRYYEWDD